MENYLNSFKFKTFKFIFKSRNTIYISQEMVTSYFIKSKLQEVGLPGGPVAKTPSPQCRGPRFDPWSGN